MKEPRSINLHLGALSKPISEQLTNQEFKFDNETINHFEKDLDALNRVRIRGIIVDSHADKCFKKLYDKIVKHVLKENGLKKA